MQKNLLLTGNIQVGKSTAINRALENMGHIKIGGFRTIGANYTPDGRSDVVLYPADQTPDAGHVVAHRGNGFPEPFPAVFDRYGPEYLKRDADLILMDELGFMETKAYTFQEAVKETLEKPTPVLGVIRYGRSTPFLDELRKRDDITILMVTEENRNEIPDKIMDFLREAGLSL